MKKFILFSSLGPVLGTVLLFVAQAHAGSVTLTSYYPVPNGHYTTLSASGNLGVGTDAPTSKLQVNYNSGSNGSREFQDYGVLTTSNYGQAALGAMYVGDGIARLNLGRVENLTGANPQFWGFSSRLSSESQRLYLQRFDFSTSPGSSLVAMAVSTDGNVGIGPTAPLAKLHVDTANTSNAALLLSKASNKPVFSILPWNQQVFLSAGIYYANGNWIQQSNSNNNEIFTMTPGTGVTWYASDNGSSSWNVASGVTLWDASGYWNNVVKSTAVGNSYFTGGNLGVGVASPSEKLHVEGNGLFNAANTTANLTVRSTGDNYSNFNLIQDSSASGGQKRWWHLSSRLSGEGYALQLYTRDSSGWHGPFWTVSKAGNVGIGVAAPTATLEVGGTTYISAGNLGVGVQAPTQKLEVAGTIKGDSAQVTTVQLTPVNTGSLPATQGALAYDSTAGTIKVANGSTWNTVGGGGGCYTAHCGTAGACCLTGFTNMGSLGNYCSIFGATAYGENTPSARYEPPSNSNLCGGSDYSSQYVNYGHYSLWYIVVKGSRGQAFLCCKS